MSEWQWAITFDAHKLGCSHGVKSPERVLVRPFEPTDPEERRKYRGCDATKFYECNDGFLSVVCEHELLTD